MEHVEATTQLSLSKQLTKMPHYIGIDDPCHRADIHKKFQPSCTRVLDRCCVALVLSSTLGIGLLERMMQVAMVYSDEMGVLYISPKSQAMSSKACSPLPSTFAYISSPPDRKNEPLGLQTSSVAAILPQVFQKRDLHNGSSAFTVVRLSSSPETGY